ncbi:MAG TPA: Eco57I restriction-modification methylase domain-containing protein [Bacteroidales bacterium]|nr:Eco57I restriction-modification methylase domain-containing protein [Bacteroidales bacterium]HQB20898.1 Eco57I restriction-modification methylase domain-containing protein [Bacteroidales bacterium]
MFQEARKYQAFYTKSTPIVDYMVQNLSLKSDDRILEPCGGDGVFVESIIDKNEYAYVDIYELNEKSIKILNKKFSYLPNVRIKHSDTLLDEELIFNSSFGGIYDKIIANPPYGAWQDYEKRDVLKKLFPNIYTKETYGLFLYRSIELLRDKGLLTFIIPDTYLNLHMHKDLRKHILKKTKIKELALFPSSFFPGVNFGYANLSIITLEKCFNQKECLNNNFKIINGFKNVEQLSDINSETDLNIKIYHQKDIYTNPDHAFLISDNFEIINAINNSKLKIGDIASCVTGFYSGDDKTFLQVSNTDLKNAKNYNIVNPNSINRDYQNISNLLDGITGTKYFIPIVKGGNVKYLKSEGWFMNWSKEAVKHYKTDKKARFQNPQFYFKFGIGVPMISSSSITASLIEYKLFDQSIVGIFPKDENLTYYLLAFFNSPTCNKFIRTINPSANNPANYIKKIPFIIPEKHVLNLINQKTSEILNSIKQLGGYNDDTEREIWSIIEEIYQID